MLSVSPRRLPLLVPIALLAACGPKAPDQSATATVAGDSPAEVATDWTVENPTERAVPVTLPTTHLTNAPVATATGK